MIRFIGYDEISSDVLYRWGMSGFSLKFPCTGNRRAGGGFIDQELPGLHHPPTLQPDDARQSGRSFLEYFPPIIERLCTHKRVNSSPIRFDPVIGAPEISPVFQLPSKFGCRLARML